MCGLVGGMSNYLSQGEVETIQQLGLLSSFRGMDSTGMMIGTSSGKKGRGLKYVYDKEAVLPAEFLYNGRYKSVIKEAGAPWLVAIHTRAATIGKIDKANAHPYVYKHICGMHNGTVPKYEPRPDDNGVLAADTDSYAIIQDLADLGVVETLKKAQHGAYALVWVDTKTNKLHMVRNDKRPLWLVYTKGHGTFYWASERRMLDFIERGCSYSFEEPFMLEANHLYTFDAKDTEFKVEKLNIPVVAPSYSFKDKEDKDRIPFSALFAREKEKKKKTGEIGGGTDTSEETEVKDFGKFVSRLPGLDKVEFLGYNERLPMYKARTLLQEGCALCPEVPDADDDRTTVHWFTPHEFLCSKCFSKQSSRDFVREYAGMEHDERFQLGTKVRQLQS